MKIRFVTLIIVVLLVFVVGWDAASPTGLAQAQREPGRIDYIDSIPYGDWVSAELTAETAAHLWEFEGRAGSTVSITMNALDDELDPFLLLVAMDESLLDAFLSTGEVDATNLKTVTQEWGIWLTEDDDSGENRNALIAAFELPWDGRYQIIATSCCTGDTVGAYELLLSTMITLEPPSSAFPEDDTPFIPPTTRIINAEVAARYLLEMAEDGTVIVFAEELENGRRPIEVGDVLAFDPTEFTPTGLLRRVVDKQVQSGEIILTTEQASLTEAIYNGVVQARVVLTPDGGFVAEAKPDWLTSKRGARPYEAGFSVELFDEEIVPGVTASGTVLFEPSFEFDMVIEHFRLTKLVLKNTTRQSGEFTLEAKAAYSDSAEIPLQPLGEFAPIGVEVLDTDFTIWFTPELTLYLGLAGSAEAAVTATINQEIIYDVGLVYEAEQLDLLVDSHGGKIEVEPPTVSSEVKAKAYLKPELALVVFGGTGPTIAAEGYIRFWADPCAAEMPWWEIVGGVSGLVGAKVGIFSINLLDEEWPILVEEWPLVEATEPSPIDCTSDLTPTPLPPSPPSKTPIWVWLVIGAFIVAALWYFFGREA